MLKMQPDKWKHVIVGIMLGAGMQFFFTEIILWSTWSSIIITLVAVTAIAYGFELFSLVTGKGHYEVMDAVATVAGGLVGIGAIAGIMAILS